MYRLLCFVVLLSSVSGSSAFSIDTNRIVESVPDFLLDLVLTEVKQYLVEHGETAVPIEDFSAGFRYSIMGIETDVLFNLTGGSFRNPATIRRHGGTHLRVNSTTAVYDLQVSFSQMLVSFDSYLIDFLGAIGGGSVEVGVGRNALGLEVTVVLKPRCTVELSRVEVLRLGDLKVRLTGLGPLDSLADEVVAEVVSLFKTSFAAKIEGVVRSKMEDVLVHTRICRMVARTANGL